MLTGVLFFGVRVGSSQMISFVLLSLICLLFAGCAGNSVVMDVRDGTPGSTLGPTDSAEISRPGAVEFPDAEFIETSSGLRYRILRNGNEKRPQPTDTVFCHYKGWLDDGSIFDSSYRRGDPTSFVLVQVIPGWTEGLQLVGEGGMIELEIPHFLGYGDVGYPPTIPPKAKLHFIVELIRVD